MKLLVSTKSGSWFILTVSCLFILSGCHDPERERLDKERQAILKEINRIDQLRKQIDNSETSYIQENQERPGQKLGVD
jgi:hypothetical protein